MITTFEMLQDYLNAHYSNSNKIFTLTNFSDDGDLIIITCDYIYKNDKDKVVHKLTTFISILDILTFIYSKL